MASLRLSLSFFLLLLTHVLAIWPEPTTFTHGASVLWLSPNVQFLSSALNSSASYGWRRYAAFAGLETLYDFMHAQFPSSRDAASANPSEATILQAAVQRTQQSLLSSQFVPWKFHPRDASFEPVLNASAVAVRQVQLNQKQAPLTIGSNASNYLDGDESYELEITANGTAMITSNATIGTIRGLQTFAQLFYAHSSGSGTYTPYAPVSITDSPKWRHRGLNLDIARSVFSPSDVMRTIDAMATAKFSRLHIHATDAQSWPLVVPSLPDLSTKGSYNPSVAWSPADLAYVQAYGLYRGIAVYIEIDMPGHTAAVAYAYPDLVTAFNELDWDTFSAEPPSGQLKLNSSDVTNFVSTLLNDLLPRSAPYTSYFHTGGDELNVNCYLLDPTVQSNSSDVIQPLLQAFVSHAHSIVRGAGLTPIVWEEMLLDWNLTLSAANSSTNGSDTIVQVWQSAANLQLVLEKGYRALFGSYDYWYLDCGHGGFINPYADPTLTSPPGVPYNTSGGVKTQIEDPYLDYCSPLKNWRHIYMYDPLTNITSDVEHLIEGGEVHLWTEQTDSTSMDGVIWPRAAAAAEVMWSGPRNASGIKDASFRLGEWRERAVVDLNVASGAVQMVWCLMGEGSCEL